MLYMFLEDGFEETEAIATLDIIRRTEIEIATVSDKDLVCGSHNVKIAPDLKYDEITFENLSGVILPGGQPGTDNLKKNKTVTEFLKYAYENNLLIAAICAAPSVPGSLGFLKGKKATCFPGYENELIGAEVSGNKVEKDGNFITAKGAGASFLFGSSIVEYFKGKEIAESIINKIYG